MKKYIIFLLLICLVLIGASCSKEDSSKKESEYADPFDGRQKEVKITDNELRDFNPKVSGDGETIVYFKDTDEDRYQDSLGIATPKGEKRTIKIRGGLMHEKTGIIVDSLDISRNGKKVAFIAAPFIENKWGTWPNPEYVFVLDLETENLSKIDPQELPEKHYPPEADAERADPVRVALSNDGSMVAFTVDIWGVDFDSIHDSWSGDDDMLLIAPSDGSREPTVLKRGINPMHVDMDSEGRIFYCKTDDEDYNKFELSVINSDGSGNKELGINLSYSGYWGLSASNNGRVVSLDRDNDVMFVADYNGTILAQTDKYSRQVAITGDGSRVLGYQERTKDVPEEERGLVYYNVNDNFSVEQIMSLKELKEKDWVTSGTFFSTSDSGGVIAGQVNDGRYGDPEIISIYWKD